MVMKKKILKSKYEKDWNGFPITVLRIDEIWQSMIPGRFPSHYDIIADVIGVIFGITICIFFINKTQ